MLRGLLPKEVDFFNYFDEHISLGVQTSKILLELAEGADIAEKAKEIKNLEHQMDDIVHHCTEQLYRTFITPIDRTDILKLIKRLDDIGDCIHGAASRIELYELTNMRPEIKEIANILIKSTEEIAKALKGLRKTKLDKEINEYCINVHHFESEGDEILRRAIIKLFKEDNPIDIIKWKEIFERLEKAVDRCEDVAIIIEGILIAST